MRSIHQFRLRIAVLGTKIAQMSHPTHFAFADESGDAGMDRIDPGFPVLSFATCLFDVDIYRETVIPAVRDLKTRYFGDATVILHEREIRRARGPFTFMGGKQIRQAFEQDLVELVEALPFVIIASVVHKTRLRDHYPRPDDPYSLCLRFVFERVRMFLDSASGPETLAHLTVESRTPTADRKLRAAFDRFRRSDHMGQPLRNVQLEFAPKSAGHVGLEIADLIANPIARHVLRRQAGLIPFSAIEPKLRRSPQGVTAGWGLKVFP